MLLAGDAAYVNNPIGGLGLNCGIHDAVELAQCLERFCGAEGVADELDLYDRRRRPINIEFVQSQTVANKKRLEEKNPVVRARFPAAHFAHRQCAQGRAYHVGAMFTSCFT